MLPRRNSPHWQGCTQKENKKIENDTLSKWNPKGGGRNNYIHSQQNRLQAKISQKRQRRSLYIDKRNNLSKVIII
jgi:hypothetical protein